MPNALDTTAPLAAHARDVVARAVAAVGLLGVALIHVLDIPHAFAEIPYQGGLYVALILGCVGAAGALVLGGSPLAWLAALLLTLGAASAYVVSRTFGLPQGADDIGNWGNSLGIASLFVEALLVALSAAVLAVKRSTYRHARQMCVHAYPSENSPSTTRAEARPSSSSQYFARHAS